MVKRASLLSETRSCGEVELIVQHHLHGQAGPLSEISLAKEKGGGTEKDLSVTFSESFDWSEHIEQSMRKANKTKSMDFLRTLTCFFHSTNRW